MIATRTQVPDPARTLLARATFALSDGTAPKTIATLDAARNELIPGYSSLGSAAVVAVNHSTGGGRLVSISGTTNASTNQGIVLEVLVAGSVVRRWRANVASGAGYAAVGATNLMDDSSAPFMNRDSVGNRYMELPAGAVIRASLTAALTGSDALNISVEVLQY